MNSQSIVSNTSRTSSTSKGWKRTSPSSNSNTKKKSTTASSNQKKKLEYKDRKIVKVEKPTRFSSRGNNQIKNRPNYKEQDSDEDDMMMEDDDTRDNNRQSNTKQKKLSVSFTKKENQEEEEEEDNDDNEEDKESDEGNISDLSGDEDQIYAGSTTSSSAIVSTKIKQKSTKKQKSNKKQKTSAGYQPKQTMSEKENSKNGKPKRRRRAR